MTDSTLFGTINSKIHNMSKREKLETRIRNNPKNVSLDEFETLVNIHGRVDMGSKHAKARIAQYTLTYKRVNPIPMEYIIDLLEIIDSL